jgi:hypothetical protein
MKSLKLRFLRYTVDRGFPITIRKIASGVATDSNRRSIMKTDVP